MKRRFSPLVASLSLLGMISVPVFAADNNQNMQKLSAQVSQLQEQVAELQSQIASGHATSSHKAVKKHHRKATTPATTEVATTTAAAEAAGKAKEQDVNSGGVELPTTGLTYLPVDVDVPGQSFVSSGPYIGVPLQFSGGNLIVNTPSVNNDVALLKIRKNIHQRLKALGVTEEQDHAHVLLSGIIEGQALYKQIGGGSDSTDIDITNATLDAYILGPSDWLSSLISFSHDSNPGTESGSLANTSRVQNSRIFLRQAFVTIGNLSETPVYGTFGQLFVPFGSYASNMVSSPLTQVLARTKQRAIVLGYQPQVDNTPYAAAYVFRGDTHVGSTRRVNNGGVNLGYRFVDGSVTGDLGGGVIANLADSGGMQFVSNSATTFNGFGGTSGTGSEYISHGVPAVDLRGMLGIGEHVDLLAEYITATKHFSQTDLTMNNHGARPQALNAEAAYTFEAFSRPNSIAIGYGMTKDALALQMSAQRYSLVMNTSIWRDTLQSIELRHDINYAASSFATGSGVPAPAGSGHSDNAITAQFDVYF